MTQKNKRKLTIAAELHHMQKNSRELEKNSLWFLQHQQFFNVFRSKIKSKEKRDRLWNVLGEGATKKLKSTNLTKVKTFSEGLCEKSPELASHRMKYICVALQVPNNTPSQSSIDLSNRNKTDSIPDVSSTPLQKALFDIITITMKLLQRNHDGEGRSLA